MAVGASESPPHYSDEDSQKQSSDRSKVNSINGGKSAEIGWKDNENSNQKDADAKEAVETDALNANSNTAEVDDDDEDEDPEYQCGWFGVTSPCLGVFRSPKWALALLCLSSIMQGFIVNGLLNVVISTIEKVRVYLLAVTCPSFNFLTT